MKANIFNIQKYSIHDGSGIRTVIFFKGCSLRCPWCANPESQSPPTQLLWDDKKCFYGHLCEIHCPTGSLTFENDVLHFAHETCIGCHSCVTQCPTKALEFAGKMIELDDVMNEILKDKDFYEEPGSGVTLTGGEALEQPEFATELLKRCKALSIHTSVETSGYATPLVFSKVARNADLLIFDIKHYDNKEHIKYTGVSQGKILENLDSAIAMRIPVSVRIPVIPGINNSSIDAKNFVELLKKHRVTAVTLLPLPLKDGNPPTPEDLEEYLDVFKTAGMNVSI
ncbi:MAG: glycyl-radical enzyme activating protein [Clostridium sp.]